ncbi:unnamed protein product [Periconia digitata]|uniref:Uncharacterized protein n=1 Tax=Periconia digitata TaxID=1303443 RepID=A0A9W4USB0_9PLEO|nr:unnamed protein product [Periconia digitata]
MDTAFSHVLSFPTFECYSMDPNKHLFTVCGRAVQNTRGVIGRILKTIGCAASQVTPTPRTSIPSCHLLSSWRQTGHLLLGICHDASSVVHSQSRLHV